MNILELIKLSWVALTANKLRSILTTLGIIIGVFAIILLVSLGSGLQTYITNQISGLGSNLIFIIPGTTTGPRTPGGVVVNKLLTNDADTLAFRLKSIANVSAVVNKSITIKYQNKSDKGAGAYGVSANYPQIVSITVETGSFFTTGQEQSGARVVLLGQSVLNKFFPNSSPLGKTITIGSSRFTIIGTIGKRGSIFGLDQDNSVIVPLSTAKEVFNVKNPNVIYITAKKPELVNFVKSQAQKILLKRLTEDDFSIETQESALSTVTNITNILSIALGGVAAISLLVGGIGVANIMLVSVTERTKEIGLRKALGARRADILKQFLLEAIILSVAGGTIGILLGLGASILVSIFFISTVTPWSVFLAFFFSIAVGVVFGMAPALKASKLSPIEALRYE